MRVLKINRRGILMAVSAGVLSLGFAACQSTAEAPAVQEKTTSTTTTSSAPTAPEASERAARRAERAARGERGARGNGEGGQRGQRGDRGQRAKTPGFDQAAETLGVSSDDLLTAMREAGGRNADLSVVAQKLGVSEEALRAALPARRTR